MSTNETQETDVMNGRTEGRRKGVGKKTPLKIIKA